MKQNWLRHGADPGGTRRRYLRTGGEILGLLVAAVFLGYVMQRLHHANLSVIFLLAVVIIATRHGLWPSVITSALGFLAFNFFFTVPYGSLRVTEDADIATLVFFLTIAILGGNLASRLRTAIRRRDQALDRISNLYDFSDRVADAKTGREVLRTLVRFIADTMDARTEVRSPDGHRPAVLAASSGTDSSDEAFREADESGEPDLSIPNDGGQVVRHLAVPEIGTCRLVVHRAGLTAEQGELIRTLCGQAEVAMDRMRLAADLESSRRESERARLRSALLTSVSHDLRTPLASIIGAGSTVHEFGDALTKEDRDELMETVVGEARRLNGYIQNLLDMTRIEHGELRLQREWEESADLVGNAIHRLRETWPDAKVVTHIDEDADVLHVHGELFLQALYNVLDNAVRYAPGEEPVVIRCVRDGNEIRIDVTDHGPGLSADQRARMFDMFYRTESGDSRHGGTGLGLAISRGILEAHGGTVRAEAGPDGRGTRIVLSLPQAAPVSDDIEGAA
jgi:two-component system sensor histidine kinase KdpD